MTRRRKTRSRTPQLDKAKSIVARMTSSGAQRSSVVAGAIRRAGISIRTYRTARKSMGTVAVRRSRKRGRRGGGSWYTKRR